MRGEHKRKGRRVGRPRGSSPRARGAPWSGECGTERRGIIPACAGSTARPAAGRCTTRDHPRVRGEHSDTFPRVIVIEGSSPRARGAHSAPESGSSLKGIIPACAGSTKPRWFSAWFPGDHPRVCGEHNVTHSECLITKGSSPRARGARGERHDRDARSGIIPACAGSTLVESCRPVAARDHPRVRGEHQVVTGTWKGRLGSSPRARGAHRRHPRAVPARGIIPACAGSTLSPLPMIRMDRDHPRVRGEHQAARNAAKRPGIIPACAGSTENFIGWPFQTGDHPRVRGEHSRHWLKPFGYGGSSPRARGAQFA